MNVVAVVCIVEREEANGRPAVRSRCAGCAVSEAIYGQRSQGRAC